MPEPTPPRYQPQTRFTPPPGAANLLIVRHGASEAAVEGQPFPLVDGHGDPALAPDGEIQAAQVCARLARLPIAAIYVTNLRRTAQTAAPLATALHLEPIVVADLREVHLGDWEGGEFRHRVAAMDPLIVKMYTERRWDVLPNAEKAEVFSARVRAGIERIATAHANETVAVFVHGGVIGEILGQAVGANGFAMSAADNASISQLVVLGERWMVRRFNDTAHLDDEWSTAAQPLT